MHPDLTTTPGGLSAVDQRAPDTTAHEDASILPALRELERACDLLADSVFKRKIQKPVITIQSAGRRAAAGWFLHDAWNVHEGRPASEITVCAEHLAREPHEIAEVLIHELVHHCNQLDGIRDTSGGGYHNRRFRDRCVELGLRCEKLGWRGFARTSLTAELREKVDRICIDPNAFRLFRQQFSVKRAESRLRKWICACQPCPTIIRAAGEIDVTCNVCGARFSRPLSALQAAMTILALPSKRLSS